MIITNDWDIFQKYMGPWAHEDYYRSYTDDLNKAKNGEMAVLEEEEEDAANDDVFDMSQVE